MSASLSWEQEFAGLAAGLRGQGTITAAQADLLQQLAAEVGALTAARKGRREALVRTALPLTAEERERLEAWLTRRFGRGWRLVYQVDPGVLGGVWLRVGDQVIDGSLRGRLQSLRERMGGKRC